MDQAPSTRTGSSSGWLPITLRCLAAVLLNLETGHGKGLCDGVGGSLKWNAQTAASAGVAIVRNAPTMYLWAKDRPNSLIQ